MLKNNRSKPLSEKHADIEKAHHHRYTWFHFLVKEAVDQGLDIEFARNAIRSCGVFHGETLFPKFSEETDLHELVKAFINDNVKAIFEVEEEVTDDTMITRFHYCPAVAQWQKLGVSEENIKLYCDMGMDGDRGIFSVYPDLEMELTKTIARGDNICEIILTRKD